MLPVKSRVKNPAVSAAETMGNFKDALMVILSNVSVKSKGEFGSKLYLESADAPILMGDFDLSSPPASFLTFQGAVNSRGVFTFKSATVSINNDLS